MPRRYRRRAPRRRRRRFRRRRYRKKAPASRITMRRMPSLFPDCAIVTFKFTDQLVLGLTAGTLLNYTYTLNAPNVPNPLAPGIRPMGWDEWSGFYTRFLCFGSSIKFQFMSDSVSPWEFFIGPDSDATGPTTMGQATELPYYSNRIINSAYAPQSRASHKCLVKALEGHRLGNEQDYVGQMGTTVLPAITKYWQIGANSPFIAQTVRMRITIFYKVKLIRRRTTIPQS